MGIPVTTTIDFETKPIASRPHYPPEPAGFSIKRPGDRRSKYYAFAHPTDNNCTKEQATKILKEVWRNDTNLLFQNGKFDYDVATTHMRGLPKISWDKMHDTLYLLFLYDPYAHSLALKPSAERLLGMKPTERDDLQGWITANIPEARRKPSEWFNYIWRAPGSVVGRYADGDVVRTDLLFKKLYPEICKRDMLQAYDRERHLMPIMLENERQGIRINLPLLERDYKVYTAALEKADNWLRKRLGAPDMNIDSDAQFAEALYRNKVVTNFVRTKTGRASVSKKNLTLGMFRDKQVQAVYGYRNILATCLGTFMAPWLEQARQTGGQIHTTWNQVRQPEHGGARTGRFSSHPNFQNIPKNWKKAIADGYVYPAFLRVPPLPLMRQYFLPDDAQSLWGRRDYNQQELRLLAHFEDGDLLQMYLDDPRLDIHQRVQDYILEIVHLDLPRDPVKILNFADIYGQGLATLAERMHTDLQTTKKLRRAKDSVLPGVKVLADACKRRGAADEAIRTWGSRLYYSEPSKFSKKYGRWMDFHYKLLNYLIQGSASDVTKESIIRYHEHPKCGPTTGDARFIVTVHDENDISAKKKVFKEEMLRLRDVMQSVEVDVPMLSDGEGGKDWGHLQKLKEV